MLIFIQKQSLTNLWAIYLSIKIYNRKQMINEKMLKHIRIQSILWNIDLQISIKLLERFFLCCNKFGHVMYQKSIEYSTLSIDLTFQSYLNEHFLIYRAGISIESDYLYSHIIIDAHVCVHTFYLTDKHTNCVNFIYFIRSFIHVIVTKLTQYANLAIFFIIKSL